MLKGRVKVEFFKDIWIITVTMGRVTPKTKNFTKGETDQSCDEL